MVLGTLETVASEDHGSISRVKNTVRLWVPPNLISVLTVTGTWALEANTNVVSLATNDVGGATELLYIPFPSDKISDLITRGSTAVNRGLRVIGFELSYEVAASALAAILLFIYSTAVAADGNGTTTVVSSTSTWDDAGAGTEIDDHRVEVLIAEADRTFLDSGAVVHGVIDLDDGTASDVNILGATWFLEEHEE